SLATQHLPVLRDLLGAADIRDHLKTFACLWHTLESENLDWCRWSGFSDCFATIIEHRPDAAKNLAHDKRLVNSQGPLLHEHCGHGAATTIEFCFQDYAGSQTSGTGPQVENVGSEQHCFQ